LATYIFTLANNRAKVACRPNGQGYGQQRKSKGDAMADETVTRGKNPVKVMVSCTNGHDYNGQVYLEEGERLTDLMNDGRAFLPLQQVSGQIIVIAKSAIYFANEITDTGQNVGSMTFRRG
jgi:hypothetical protein